MVQGRRKVSIIGGHTFSWIQVLAAQNIGVAYCLNKTIVKFSHHGKNVAKFRKRVTRKLKYKVFNEKICLKTQGNSAIK